ncbi:unnamed protein product, partial [Tetraodon nigroviridis]
QGKFEYLVKWRGWSSKEQERELLFQKKGKRPRGRPRKHPLPEVAADRSSSSSSSGLSEPSSDDEEQVKKVKPGPRVQPGPQKRPQILLARPDPPRRKKRGRKPLHADLRTKTESPPLPSRHHHLIRPQRVELRPGMKKPLQPASFTYTGLTRTSREESSTSSSSFSHTSTKPGSMSGTWSNRTLNSSCGSASFSRTSPSPQNKMSLSELKRSVLDSSSFKTLPLKSPGAASSLGLPGGFGGGQGVQRSPLSLRKAEGGGGASCLVQHKQNSGLSKPSSSPAHRDRLNQALSLRTLNLQSVGRVPAGGGHQGSGVGGGVGGGAGGAASRSSLRSIAGVVKADRIKDTRAPAGQGRTHPAGGVAKETLAGGARLEDRNPSRGGNELSAGDSDESSSSESEAAAALYMGNSRRSLGDDTNESDAETDWRPARSLLEHVFVTDVTANFLTVTVKESPTSVGFFSSGTH